MGVEPPRYANAANGELTDYIDRALAGRKADRVFIYKTDAIGQRMIEKYPEISEEARKRMELELPMWTVDPPKTPCCFRAKKRASPSAEGEAFL